MPECPMAIPSQIAMAGNFAAVPPAMAMLFTASAIVFKCAWLYQYCYKSLPHQLRSF